MSYLGFLYFPADRLSQATALLEESGVFWTFENLADDFHPPPRLLESIGPLESLAVLKLTAKIDLIEQFIWWLRREEPKSALDSLMYELSVSGLSGALCMTIEGGNKEWWNIPVDSAAWSSAAVELFDSSLHRRQVFPEFGIFLSFGKEDTLDVGT